MVGRERERKWQIKIPSLILVVLYPFPRFYTMQRDAIVESLELKYEIPVMANSLAESLCLIFKTQWSCLRNLADDPGMWLFNEYRLKAVLFHFVEFTAHHVGIKIWNSSDESVIEDWRIVNGPLVFCTCLFQSLYFYWSLFSCHMMQDQGLGYFSVQCTSSHVSWEGLESLWNLFLKSSAPSVFFDLARTGISENSRKVFRLLLPPVS